LIFSIMDAPISVLIPCYRCADTVTYAVESVVKQTYPPAEIILVDDGSGDATLDTLLNLQTEYGASWIKIISLSCNYGPSYARNVGWDLATQDYIAFLDADDVWHPKKIELQYEWMRRHPEILISGHRYLVVDPDTVLPQLPVQAQFATHPIGRNRLLLSNPFVTPAIMLKRDLPYRFDPKRRYCEDYYLWLQLVCDGFAMVMLETTLVYVRKRIGTSGMSQHVWRMRAGDIQNYIQLWQSRKINFSLMSGLVSLSIFKFLALLLLGPKRHFSIKQRIDHSVSQ
jgi:glycosyltransferase involved in cell wall biosynthesis